MSAQQTIVAAIEKLETLRRASRRGPWDVVPVRGNQFQIIDADRDSIAYSVASGTTFPPSFAGVDAALIVALHRTIDAQLAILRQAHAELEALPSGLRLPDDAVARELELARAILGEA